MLERIYNLYSFIFSREVFCKFNKLLYQLSLRGLGILSYQNFKISGESFILNRLFGKGEVVIFDVGSHEGRFLRAIKEINTNAKVYAFEPHPKTFQKLISLSKIDGVKVNNFGFGQMEMTTELYDYQNQDGSPHASIYSEVFSKIHESETASHQISLKCLDNFIETEKIKTIDLLKIDTEGNELNVLMGAKETISKGKIKVIQFEFNEFNILNRIFLRDFFELLKDFQFYRILRKGIMPLRNYDSSLCEIFLFQNILAVHKDYLSDYNYSF